MEWETAAEIVHVAGIRTDEWAEKVWVNDEGKALDMASRESTLEKWGDGEDHRAALIKLVC